MIDISMLGDKRLQRALNRLEDTEAKKIIRRALRDGAKITKARVDQTAPVMTGKLRSSMKVRAGKGGRGGIRINVQAGTRETLGIDDKGKWYYPAHVEYGHGNVPAIPFMRTSADETEGAARAKIAQTIARELHIAWRKP